jgi:hypothetical protein
VKHWKRGSRPLVVATVTAFSIVLAPLSASASYTYSYNVKASTYLSTIGRCVEVQALGSIRYDVYQHTSAYANYTNRKVLNPNVTVRTYDSCNPLTRNGRTVSKLSMEQKMFSNTCASSLAFSVAFPWGVGVEPTVKCGSVNAARYTTSYGTGQTFTQYNSGSTIGLGNEYDAPLVWFRNSVTGVITRYNLCIPIQVDTTVYSGTVSDTFRPTLNACVPHP